MLALMMIAAQSWAQEGRQIARELGTVPGVVYGFLQYTPGAYDTLPNVKYPLVIFLHGDGSRGNGTTDLVPKVTRNGPPKIIANGGDYNAIILSPQLAPTGGWYAPAIDGLISYALNTMRIEPDRIYITGLSIGGGGTWEFPQYSDATRDRTAAIIPIATIPASSTPSRMVGMPVWAFHNQTDASCDLSFSVSQVNAAVSPTSNVMIGKPDGTATAGWNGVAWTWLAGTTRQAANPLFTVYGVTGHDAWTATYANTAVWDWLFDQHKPRAPVDIVMDEQDTGTNRTSVNAWAWGTSNAAPGAYNGVYFYLWSNEPGTFQFTPTIAHGSRYEVSVWYPISTARGIVPHDVYYGDGRSVATVDVDQRVGGGAWRVLGTYWLNAGAGRVVIRSSGLPYGVVADAVRFREVSTLSAPSASN